MVKQQDHNRSMLPRSNELLTHPVTGLFEVVVLVECDDMSGAFKAPGLESALAMSTQYPRHGKAES